MDKSGFRMVLFTGIICFITFFLTGYLVSLFLGIASVGMLLQILGEKIISKIMNSNTEETI